MNKIVLVTFVMFALTGCAGFGDTSDTNDWYGVMGREAFVAHQYDQVAVSIEEENLDTYRLLQKNLRAAIANGNSAGIANTLAIISSIESGTSPECRKLGIENQTTDFVVTITSFPFNGNTLNPGMKMSKRVCIPVGLYRLEYQECRVGSSRCKNTSVNVSIDPQRTSPIVISKR